MSDFPYRVRVSYSRRQEVGTFLSRSGVRRSQVWRQYGSSDDIYCFKKAQHAILLKFYLDE